MPSYLGIIDAEEECAVCAKPVPAGFAGHTDDMPPQPLCLGCLLHHDERLLMILLLIESLRHLSCTMDPDSTPEDLSEKVRQMLRFIQFCLPATRA